jgi:hypothetical protein
MGPDQVEEKQMATSSKEIVKPLKQPSQALVAQIMVKITETACFRAAQTSPDYLKFMSVRLSKENPEYVMQALTSLGERKRGEGETALLDLATILEEIKLLTPRKKTQYEQDAEELFAEQRKAREQAIGN